MFCRGVVTLDDDKLADMCFAVLDEFNLVPAVARSESQAGSDAAKFHIRADLAHCVDEHFPVVSTFAIFFIRFQIIALVHCHDLYFRKVIHPVYQISTKQIIYTQAYGPIFSRGLCQFCPKNLSTAPEK